MRRKKIRRKKFSCMLFVWIKEKREKKENLFSFICLGKKLKEENKGKKIKMIFLLLVCIKMYEKWKLNLVEWNFILKFNIFI